MLSFCHFLVIWPSSITHLVPSNFSLKKFQTVEKDFALTFFILINVMFIAADSKDLLHLGEHNTGEHSDCHFVNILVQEHIVLILIL